METNKRHSRLVPVCAMFAGASVLMSAMTISTKTVAVYDGAERKLVHTTANDPGIVARAAGLQLSADDDVFFTDDPADGFGVLQINRAFPVLISADGKAHMLQTTGGTVSSRCRILCATHAGACTLGLPIVKLNTFSAPTTAARASP